MKKIFLTLAIAIICYCSYAQTNTFPTTGNAGIGTTSPQSLLNLQQPFGAELMFSDGYQGAGNYRNSIKNTLYGSNNASANQMQFWIGNGTETGQTNVLTLRGDGNVGIGTTSPHQRLDLNGGSMAMGDINATGVITFRNDIPVGTAGSVGISAIDAASNGNYDGLGLHVSDGLKILSGSNTYFTLLTATGNVGIGTTTPDAKLAVKGTIHTQEVKVDLQVPGPDYVFNDDYKLITLTEIKDYVTKNHHLPEIPSAAQMATEGINLGDMNTKLLKKVEELTLYAIDQQKQIEQLKQEQQKSKEQEARITALETALAKLTGK